MGCVSSKLVKKEIKREILLNNGGDYVNHVVSLKSSTYGVLKLDNVELQQQQQQQQEVAVSEAKRVQRSPAREEPEVINAWELMEDLEEDGFIKRSPKSRGLFKGGKDVRSPLKFFNQIGSPLKVKKFGGKENKGRVNGLGYGNDKFDFSPKSILRVNNSTDNSCKAVLKLSYPVKSTRSEGTEGGDSGFSSRRSINPLFDPELVALYDKELSEEEQIKRIISPQPEIRKSKKSQDAKANLQVFDKKCQAAGDNAVVIYTTTLRGIRKTFEECNTVRSIIESYHIQMFERDVSMDSGFKEELRKLTGRNEVKVPLVLVKGRLIGGVEEIVRLEEEGKLEILFDGIPRRIPGCQGCGGVRFVMCMECNGSCKVLDREQKKIT
ncbi:hypothetical protein DITRI_Ditri12bG0134000 [Diplodiscus trichospermus]